MNKNLKKIIVYTGLGLALAATGYKVIDEYNKMGENAAQKVHDYYDPNDNLKN